MATPEDQALLAFKIEAVASDLQEIKTTMRDLAVAVSKLAVIEERQTATNEAINRAFKDIGTLSVRVASLEANQPLQKQSSDYVQGAVKYIIAIVLGAVISGLWRSAPGPATVQPPAISSK